MGVGVWCVRGSALGDCWVDRLLHAAAMAQTAHTAAGGEACTTTAGPERAVDADDGELR